MEVGRNPKATSSWFATLNHLLLNPPQPLSPPASNPFARQHRAWYVKSTQQNVRAWEKQERRMADEGRLEQDMTESTREPAQREWRPPLLRSLPIAATAGSGKATIRGNDGQGGGKGDVSTLHS